MLSLIKFQYLRWLIFEIGWTLPIFLSFYWRLIFHVMTTIFVQLSATIRTFTFFQICHLSIFVYICLNSNHGCAETLLWFYNILVDFLDSHCKSYEIVMWNNPLYTYLYVFCYMLKSKILGNERLSKHFHHFQNFNSTFCGNEMSRLK